MNLNTPRGLIEYAFHLRQNGENAPGGNETWYEWEHNAERWLRDATIELQLTCNACQATGPAYQFRATPQLGLPYCQDTKACAARVDALYPRDNVQLVLPYPPHSTDTLPYYTEYDYPEGDEPPDYDHSTRL